MMFILNAIILASGMLFGVAIIFALVVIFTHAFLVDDE
jgi:hypothetical protein